MKDFRDYAELGAAWANIQADPDETLPVDAIERNVALDEYNAGTKVFDRYRNFAVWPGSKP